MFAEDKIILGYVPVRRDFFPQKAAEETRDQIRNRVEDIMKKQNNVELVNVDHLLDDKMIWDFTQVPPVVEYLKNKKIDALFLPHCNFGQEEVVGQLGRDLGVPVLVWGPRDPRPDPSGAFRPWDTQCGMFASTKALYRYNVPYSYIENCWLDSPVLDRGIDDFIRVAAVVKAFRHMRVGQIGLRPRPFFSIKISEADLMQKLGIEVTPIWLEELQNVVNKLKRGKVEKLKFNEGPFFSPPPAEAGEPDPRINKVVSDIKARLDCSAMSDENLATIAALEVAIIELAKNVGCTAVAVDCWNHIPVQFGVGACFLLGDIMDAGLVAACETDIYAAITARMLQAANRSASPPFIADLTIRHPDNDNAELLWHCGPFPKSLMREGVKGAVRESKGQYEIKQGPITIARLEQDSSGDYVFFADEGAGVDGPATNGNYSWFETNDWPKWEKHFMNGPYIHHVAGIHGRHARVLKEACKYIGKIKFDSVNAVDY